MSQPVEVNLHYAAVVIGGNPGQQLKKFDRNRPTQPRFEELDPLEVQFWATMGRQTGYFEDDVTDPTPHQVLKMLQEEAEGYEDVIVLGGRLGRMSTDNPVGRFTKMEIGGWFDGYFITRSGRRTARLTRRELDLEAMQWDRRVQAEIRWREFTEATRNLRPPRHPVEQAKREVQRGLTLANALDTAKRRWWDNAWTRAAMDYDWSPDISEPWRGRSTYGIAGELMQDGHPWLTFCMDAPDPQAEFVRRKVLRAAVPMIYINRGEWHQWDLGLSDPEDDSLEATDVWARQVYDMYDSLEPQTRITAVMTTL